jgi:FtsP/CotA-like multicopper oxidase with cupredoxin domain
MKSEVLRSFGTRSLQRAGVLFIAGCLFGSYAYAHGGNEDPLPPEGDPSAFTGPVFGDLPEGLPEANEGAFDGGDTGTHVDAETSNVLQQEVQRDGGDDLFGTFNVPSNGSPSPLFGAEPFTQQMLRFEEFGTDRLRLNAGKPGGWKKLPRPADAQSIPKTGKLDNFLAQDPWPIPTKFSNDKMKNPWWRKIEAWVGRSLDDPPAEGRPPGLGWSHQRWEEFTPKLYFQTATTGARTNGGLRDDMQRHGYRKGEFGRRGLYHNTAGAAGFGGTTAGIEIKFHPNMPVQDHTTLWTFDGTFPPKLLNVRYGKPVLMRHYNALPIDVAANRGFGVHTLTTHEHNGHSPAESDGYTNAFFFPGQFYDYRWPVPLAGRDSINTDATDRRAGRPDGHGGITNVPGDWRETMSTHWFHDHMLDFTAQNVYKGSAAMMNYYSAIDRGNEGIRDGVNLRLPSGTALDWGNRDYDVNLLLAEKAWDDEGQLWFNPFNIKGFIGDVMTVNWLFDPYIEVRARRYRFRLLNGSVSRYFKIALVDEAGNRVPFHMIANDGNIMEHTVYFENGELPTQGIAERYDIVVDFSQFEPGDKLYFVNLLQHKNGQVTDVPIPLEDILSGDYQPVAVDDDADGTADRWINGDPVVGKFLEFRVKKYRGKDLSMNPAEYEPGGKTMIPLRQPTEAELANALHRTFEFEKQPTDEKPWVIETDGGKGVGMDPRRLSAAPSKNSPQLEVWRILNSGTWSHPVHIHFEEGIILRRGGMPPPEWEKWARKDVYRLGPQPDSTNMVEVALRFREFAGTYMEHCHNTQHEDHAMLLRWDIEHPGQVKLMPTPIPSWDGVTYVDTAALPTARTGDDVGEYGPSLDHQAVEIWLDGMEVEGIDLVDIEIGSAENPTDDERAVAKIPLQIGTNIDSDGNERTVYFVLHDVSDEALADDFGISWAGGLVGTPEAATSAATFDGEWTFFGDLPNPVLRGNAAFQTYPDSVTLGPPQLDTNTYSPLRRVTLAGKDVIVNAFFVQWGEEPWEHMRIDVNCDPSDPSSFPDDPPNTSCMYNGHVWSGDTGHALEINTAAAEPYARFKLHKSWTDGGDYLPYYMVLDTFPVGPANAMGIPYVPKHAFLGGAAVPLVQFIPPTPLTPPGWVGPPTYPPTAPTPDLAGGGPLGGQIGIPTYFMPEDDYSPMWHIGFTHWVDETQVKVVRGIEELKYLRAQGYLMIGEFPPPPNMFTDNYDFENLSSPHVVNCPTPVTIDTVVHGVNQKIKQVMASQ